METLFDHLRRLNNRFGYVECTDISASGRTVLVKFITSTSAEWGHTLQYDLKSKTWKVISSGAYDGERDFFRRTRQSR